MRASTTTTPRAAVTRWINDPDFVPFIGPLNFGQEEDAHQYIPLLTSDNGKPVDTIAEIDVDPYVPTRYTVNDYSDDTHLQKLVMVTQRNMGHTGEDPTL